MAQESIFGRISMMARANINAMLDKAEDRFEFPGHASRPVLSINRGFSAPVAMDAEQSEADLVFLAAHDDDPFARYEALQSLVVQHLVGVLEGKPAADGREAIGQAIAAVLDDTSLDDLMRGELLVLPGEAYLAGRMDWRAYRTMRPPGRPVVRVSSASR